MADGAALSVVSGMLQKKDATLTNLPNGSRSALSRARPLFIYNVKLHAPHLPGVDGTPETNDPGVLVKDAFNLKNSCNCKTMRKV